MQHQLIKGKNFTWYHFNNLGETDYEFLHHHFKFHPLDFDDLREAAELPKVDIYKHYIFAVFVIPTFDKAGNKIGKKNLPVFIGKDYIVTATPDSIESVERLFSRMQRNRGLKQEAMGKSTGFFLYKLLDYVFRDTNVVLQELVRETQNMEGLVYDKRTDVTTKRLGMLRGNILYFSHLIDPQRILLSHIINARKTFLSGDLDVYFDDIKDTLDAQWIVSNNLKGMVDGLFSVNEAFLTHKTNKIIRILTIISVVLMPPTLISSYYGMNVNGLPYAHDVNIVSFFVILSLLVFLGFIFYLDNKH